MRAMARGTVFEYTELFYDKQRINSTIGYVSPLAYEQAFYQRAHLP